MWWASSSCSCENWMADVVYPFCPLCSSPGIWIALGPTRCPVSVSWVCDSTCRGRSSLPSVWMWAEVQLSPASSWSPAGQKVAVVEDSSRDRWTSAEASDWPHTAPTHTHTQLHNTAIWKIKSQSIHTEIQLYHQRNNEALGQFQEVAPKNCILGSWWSFLLDTLKNIETARNI